MKRLLIVALAGLLTACSTTPKQTAPVTIEKYTDISIYDSQALEFINPKAQVEVLATGYAWTEGPLWIDEGFLLFSDIPNNTIEKYTPGEGVELYLQPSGGTGLYPDDDQGGSNGLLLSEKGELIALQQGDRRIAAMDAPLQAPTPDFIPLTDHYQGKRLNSPNDGVIASDGRLYFTDPPYGLAKGDDDPRRELDFNGVFALEPTGELVLLDDQVKAPNGIALSRDEKTLFVAVSDKDNPQWLAYDITAEGELANKRVFFDSRQVENPGPGVPDGMAVHSEGIIFATGPGGVWMFTEKAKLLAIIHTGRLTANCTLDTKQKNLYITAHDALLKVKLKP
ncbi:SMP-30/gluconolactonase/LRE family protein [Gilvimarinus agarilyticus]|uniref:SMP-30/gluconolactonase/LRE family protein n=1 Tax=Gilvimarinus sp. 2_MG-2023 TaxID=3062666 RepID=UPI001C08AF07|nr:SMP-30/gluconolactonase/LRE family protein [Gilvimarinus sp. 2_MG-2023]MBU2886392.1 SMP-30/gluconolactonase/LRE family protein [Gilvimarinus agarilyticus]MDO6571071.1 SMP-30/gluconolactonase/LRE family protein [Gilvimarinus sp. 2_MG-2023]